MDIFPSWLQYPQWWAASSSISYKATRVATVDDAADCSDWHDLDDEADDIQIFGRLANNKNK